MHQKFTSSDLERYGRDLARIKGLNPDGPYAYAAQDNAPSMMIPNPGILRTNWEVCALDAVPSLSDQQLVDIWQAVPDPESLAPIPQAVIAEMERRELDF